MSKVIYTPFVSSRFKIPESQAIQPIPISLPISEYQGVGPDREVIPVLNEPYVPKYDLSRPYVEVKYPVGEEEDYSTVEKSKPIVWKVDVKTGIQKPTIGNTYSDRKEFVKDLTEAYEKELESRGLSKEYAKYIVAQDALESSWGKSSLSRYFNFGGIKEFRDEEGVEADTKESFDGKTLKTVKQKFRKFKDLEDYVKYKIDLLGNSNFNVFAYMPDQLYSRLVNAPKKYATDPNYLSKMNQMYRSVLAIS